MATKSPKSTGLDPADPGRYLLLRRISCDISHQLYFLFIPCSLSPALFFRFLAFCFLSHASCTNLLLLVLFLFFLSLYQEPNANALRSHLAPGSPSLGFSLSPGFSCCLPAFPSVSRLFPLSPGFSRYFLSFSSLLCLHSSLLSLAPCFYCLAPVFHLWSHAIMSPVSCPLAGVCVLCRTVVYGAGYIHG